MLKQSDIDVKVELPKELLRLVKQNLIDLKPWQIMSREIALERLRGMRKRYSKKYVPFALRLDRDELACIEPDHPDRIVIVCDFEPEGSERAESYNSFWDWFRAVIEDLIEFE